MHKDVEEILVSEEEILEKCKELGKQIDNDYADEPPIVVGLLKGSIQFMAELIKNITLDIEIDFMDVSSYAGTSSSGDIKILKDLDRSIKGKKILIVEDIVDTGSTVVVVKELLYQKGATDVKIITLLNKPDRREKAVEADYIGFTVPNRFVVGYGMDYEQKYRNLPYIAVLKEEVYM